MKQYGAGPTVVPHYDVPAVPPADVVPSEQDLQIAVNEDAIRDAINQVTASEIDVDSVNADLAEAESAQIETDGFVIDETTPLIEAIEKSPLSAELQSNSTVDDVIAPPVTNSPVEETPSTTEN